MRGMQNRRIGAAFVAAASMVVGLVSVGTTAASAEEPPPPLQSFAWGTKPSGMVVASFPKVERAVWDEQADDYVFTDEPGGLAAWSRDCQDQSCWLRITSDGADRAPAWSPSGYLIAYLHGSGNAVDVRVLDTRTGETRTLATGNGSISQPTWSHDEQQIAFSEAAEQYDYEGETYYEDYDIKVVAANGSTVPNIIQHTPETALTCTYANEVGADVTVERAWPSWSPQTGNLLYLRSEQAVGGDWFCPRSLHAVRAFADEGILGAEARQEASNASMYPLMSVATPGFVEWSPDETRIIVTPQLGVTAAIYPAPGQTGPTAPVDGNGAQIPPSWAPDNAFIMSGGGMVNADGTDMDCWDTPPGIGCYMAIGETTGHDAQCKPGFCLTGIAATQVGSGDTLGATQLTGDLTGELDALNRYLVKKTGAGTYTVTATPPEGVVWDAGSCDDDNSTVALGASSATATYRVASGEFVTCTFGMDRPDGDGDGWPDDVDPCPQDPQNTCDDPEPDADMDGLPDDVDPCPADPTNTCDDPQEPDTCKPYRHEVGLDAGIAGSRLYEFDSTAIYRICTRANGTKYVDLRSVSPYGFLDSGVVPYLLGVLGFDIEYAGDARSFTSPLANGGMSATTSGKFEMCYDLLDLVDKTGLRDKVSKLILTKLVGKLGKLGKLGRQDEIEREVKRFFKKDMVDVGDKKIADFMDKAKFRVIPHQARAWIVHEAQGMWKNGMNKLATITVNTIRKLGIDKALNGKRLVKGVTKAFKKFTTVCPDVWEPKITHRFLTNGTYSVDVEPYFANPIFAKQKIATNTHEAIRSATTPR